MTDDRKKRFRKAVDGLDLNLSSLLGTLGDALGEAVSRLEQGQDGAGETSQTFETPRGPARASAGVRVRVGGLAAGKPATRAQPVNPQRAPGPAPATPAAREITYDLVEDVDSWMLIAELPGVALAEVQLAQAGEAITLTTAGPRHYAAQIAPPCRCAIDQIGLSLTNGILTMRFPKEAGA